MRIRRIALEVLSGKVGEMVSRRVLENALDDLRVLERFGVGVKEGWVEWGRRGLKAFPMDLDLVEEFREKVGEELADVFLGLGVYYAENWMLDKAKEVLDWVERFREVEAKVLKFFMGFEDCEGYLKGLLRL